MTIGITMMKRMTAKAADLPPSKFRNWVYISLAITEVSFAPAVMVRTMSKTFSEAIEMVVNTTTNEERIPGSVTLAKRCQALAPSSSAASNCSIGTP